MDFNQEQSFDEARAGSFETAAEYIRRTLSQSHYEGEIDSALDQLGFNIVVMGSPKVGKSQLINALCGNYSLAKTSSSLASCTQKVTKYVLERYNLKIEGFPPVIITIFDTPGVECWKDDEGQDKFLEFIRESNPICVMFCASPGCFTPLESLRFLLKYCKEKAIICALVCTNMWANKNRKEVIEEFKKELHIFGAEEEKKFSQGDQRNPHLVTIFGNGAFCTMVNSIEYYDEEMEIRKPAQGVDELISSIMELLDTTKLLGWCLTVLDRRSFWEKMSQKSNGFFQLRFSELHNLREASASDIGRNVLVFLSQTYLQRH